jgi:hypothetical protein
MNAFSTREKLILAGLFLSKFDAEGLNSLGFSSFSEAFNVLALCQNSSPASLKNYRDEFDPYFSNPRKVRLAPILVPPAKVENVSFNHGEMEDANGVKAKGIHG